MNRVKQEQHHSTRFMLIPDTQCRKGVPLDHIDWIAAALLEYTPDEIIVGGDWWDMPSLNSHSAKEELEGARYREDIEAGNGAFRRMAVPVEREVARQARNKKGWKPRKRFLFGNHEERILRAVREDPKWEGHISLRDCDTRDFERYPFLKRVWVGGLCMSHYFQGSHSNRAIGGSVDNRLNKVGASFCSFHEQGFRYGNRIMASGETFHGLVAGSCYLHEEGYRGPQGQRHWRGIVCLNDVRDGTYDIMPLSLSFLCRRYEGTDLHKYMAKKYPRQNWSHLD